MDSITYSKKIRIGDKEIFVQGDREYVESEFPRFLKAIFGCANIDKIPSTQIIEQEETMKKEYPANLRIFFNEKRPKNKLDNLIIVGFFIEKVEGATEYTKKDLIHRAREVKIPLGINIGRDLIELTKKGYFEKYGKKDGYDAYRLTMLGEEYIEKKLGR